MTKCDKCGCNSRWHNRMIPVAILLGLFYIGLFYMVVHI